MTLESRNVLERLVEGRPTMFLNNPTTSGANRLTNCVECGRNVEPTGNSKTARSSRPAFDCHVAPPAWFIEYMCQSCGEQAWCEAGVLEDFPEEGV